MSVARDCRCVRLSRSACYPPADNWWVRDAPIIARLATLVDGRLSWGFWKCRKLRRRQSHAWNQQPIYWVYKLMRLNLRWSARGRRPKRERLPRYVPRLPKRVWSADFMSDALICGRRYRLFNVAEDFNQEALHIEVDRSINSERLVRIFDGLRQQRGLPQILRADNGPQFLGEAFTQWAKNAGMAIQYIQPGKPNQSAYIERFNRTLRNELLEQHLFVRIGGIREAAYCWLLEYN